MIPNLGRLGRLHGKGLPSSSSFISTDRFLCQHGLKRLSAIPAQINSFSLRFRVTHPFAKNAKGWGCLS
jgi:hypothetical protein